MIFVDPRAEPFFLSGNNIVVLFIHGFTASPSEVYQVAKLLHETTGVTASGILLPGHGSHPYYLNKTTWQDWYSSVKSESEYLLANYDKVYLVGLSLGGLLSMYAGANIPGVSGVVAINSPIRLRYPILEYLAPIVQWIKPYFSKSKKSQLELKRLGRFAYDSTPVRAFISMTKFRNLTLKSLPNLKMPLLLIQTLNDETVDPAGINELQKRAGDKVRLVELEKGKHVVTIGQEVPVITSLIMKFMEKDLGGL